MDTTLSWGPRIAIDRAFIQAGASRTVRYEIADNQGVLDFVRHGLGIAISPRFFADSSPVFVPIARYAPRFVLSIAVAKDNPSTPVREMLRIFHQLADGSPAHESAESAAV